VALFVGTNQLSILVLVVVVVVVQDIVKKPKIAKRVRTIASSPVNSIRIMSSMGALVRSLSNLI
jgi:hypothetical protein